ncbi:ribonuclease T2 [Methylocapsa sp. S129]|uniref:ribonuclease T2 family protein n=1 Tax=Methylocapsa sp. S129 TaxID=1641869 RepID=UPI00131AFB10|nr:ribonuclease T2 [Methylocapsa sp. S129]
MAFGRIGIGVAFALALSVCATAGYAQSFWDNFFRGPTTAQPVQTPCVLDKCLNGAAQKPAPAQAAPDAAPTPMAPPASAGMIAPGNFDFYLLTLSWSPGFCDTGGASKSPDQCSVGSNLGFVVHGLWPQFQHGYPSDCDPSRPVSSVALQETDGVFPNEGLARYEWRKHGTCTGLSPEAFFSSVKRARASIEIPDAFNAPREQQSMAPLDIQRAFVDANPDLRPQAMAIGCSGGELQEVRLCFSKDLRDFVNCPEVARATCRAQSITIAPVH